MESINTISHLTTVITTWESPRKEIELMAFAINMLNISLCGAPITEEILSRYIIFKMAYPEIADLSIDAGFGRLIEIFFNIIHKPEDDEVTEEKEDGRVKKKHKQWRAIGTRAGLQRHMERYNAFNHRVSVSHIKDIFIINCGELNSHCVQEVATWDQQFSKCIFPIGWTAVTSCKQKILAGRVIQVEESPHFAFAIVDDLNEIEDELEIAIPYKNPMLALKEFGLDGIWSRDNVAYLGLRNDEIQAEILKFIATGEQTWTNFTSVS